MISTVCCQDTRGYEGQDGPKTHIFLKYLLDGRKSIMVALKMIYVRTEHVRLTCKLVYWL